MRAEDNICNKPFKRIEIFDTGDVHICCPEWLPHKIGNVFENSLEEIWNGPTAQEIRKEMLVGNYKKCLVHKCPFLTTGIPPVESRSNITNKILKRAVEENLTKLPFMPKAIKCSYDESCNLSCPSCRKDFFQLDSDNPQFKKVMMINDKIEAMLPHIEELHITGSGDPIGSRIYRNLINKLDTEKHKHLRVCLYTNGLLFTPNYWASLGKRQRLIHLVEVSVDAASIQTYSANRKGGNFEKLVKNLRFISDLRSKNLIAEFGLNFTVQKNNFKEMEPFVVLGKSLKSDLISFTRLLNWGTYSEADYQERDICHPQHSDHIKLCQELQKPVFQTPTVNIGNLPFASDNSHKIERTS